VIKDTAATTSEQKAKIFLKWQLRESFLITKILIWKVMPSYSPEKILKNNPPKNQDKLN